MKYIFPNTITRKHLHTFKSITCSHEWNIFASLKWLEHSLCCLAILLKEVIDKINAFDIENFAEDESYAWLDMFLYQIHLKSFSQLSTLLLLLHYQWQSLYWLYNWVLYKFKHISISLNFQNLKTKWYTRYAFNIFLRLKRNLGIKWVNCKTMKATQEKPRTQESFFYSNQSSYGHK